jgi:hypothetical protein
MRIKMKIYAKFTCGHVKRKILAFSERAMNARVQEEVTRTQHAVGQVVQA